jgi:hypothetical protein
MNDFSTAVVGDRVWDVVYGWGTVDKISGDNMFPLSVAFDKNDHITYMFTGNQTHDRPQTLFWDEIPIIAPPRPKRMVTKTVEVWMNEYKASACFSLQVYRTRREAEDVAVDGCVAQIKLTGSYEVEE